MPDMTSCHFDVSDGDGAPVRGFRFDTVQQGNQYTVTVTNDGINPYSVTLSTQKPTAQLPPNDGVRVKATGKMTLLFDQTNNPNVAVQFSGALVTAHPTW